MEALKTLLRLFSFVFHGLLTLFLIAIAAFALTSGSPSLDLGMLPWTGSTLEWVVLLSAVAGLVSLVLAVRSKLRFLFFLWALAVLAMLVRGYLFSSYHFSPGGASTAVYLTVASILALLGAWFQMFRETPRYKKY